MRITRCQAFIRRSIRPIAVFGMCMLALSCSSGRDARRTIAVAAASDMQFALPDLDEAFEARNPGVAIVPTFGASGTLTAQIANGAPFDVFFSADRAYPERLVTDGHADGSTLTTYAIGHIVLWVPNSSPVDVATAGALALTDARVRTIAIANPEHAPYGAAAIAAFATLGIADSVRAKLVFGENVAQAAQFAQSGAADAAVIGRSLAVSPRLVEAGRWWEFPANSHPRLEQVAIVTAASGSPDLSRDFLAFVTSEEGRAILERHGLGLPEGE